MIIPRELLLPQQTIAGDGSIKRLIGEAMVFGVRGVVVHGRSLVAGGGLEAIMAVAPQGAEVVSYCHEGREPTLQDVDRLREFLVESGCDWVAAVGGGSVVDLAKAAAGLRDAPLPTGDYQRGAKIAASVVPLIAAPTTAGTGSEATVVSVLTDPERELKQSIRHASFMPRLVVLDAELLHSCPRRTIAASGLDAFVQALESYTSRHANGFTRALSELALVAITENLLAVYSGDFTNAEALLEGSYLAGLALSHARLGLVHGLAHPLGSRWHAAHGLTCAVCLPPVLDFNRPVIGAALEDLRLRLGIDVERQVADWMDEMKLESPFAGEAICDREAIIRETLTSGSTAANPRAVTAEDVEVLLDNIFC